MFGRNSSVDTAPVRRSAG